MFKSIISIPIYSILANRCHDISIIIKDVVKNMEPKKSNENAGIPYDFRKPTIARTKSRYWNPDDHRFFTPKVYGAGWTVNCYWLYHPRRYFRSRH